MRCIRAVVIALVVVVAAGCTFSDVKPEIAGTPPAQPPTALIVGDIAVTDELWAPYKLHFSRAVAEWLKRNGGFDIVYAEPPATIPERAVVLRGVITKVDKGNAFARVLIGMGAGQAKVEGTFQIENPGGAVLAKFSTRESYLGGAGIGGIGYLDMEDLVKRFGETVAETARDWARGQNISAR
jgi:hypothetical protein